MSAIDRGLRGWFTAALGALTLSCGCALFAAPAEADFGIKPGTFKADLLDAEGNVYSQAAGHPFEAVTSFEFNVEQFEGPFGPAEMTEGFVKDVDVDLPPGFYGNPQAVGECSPRELSEGTGEGGGSGNHVVCPVSSQVGVASVTIGNQNFHFPNDYPIFNVTPPRGTTALLGFVVEGVPVFIRPVVRPESGYALRASAHNTPTPFAVFSTKIALWGVPADSRHDAQRWDPINGGFGMTSQAPVRAFLTAPSNCAAGPLTTVLHANAYENPERIVTETATSPTGPTGCEGLTFNPTLEVTPSTNSTDSSDGISVAIEVPQSESANGYDTPPLRDVTVALPEGVSINPSSASGLAACGDGQLQLGSSQAQSCPAGSKIGSVEATTPLLREQLSGGVYLRPQASNDPASGEMFRIALTLESEERGVSVRLPGAVRVDPASGRVEVAFRDNPQLPVSEIRVRLNTGDTAPLSTPRTCGTQTTTATISSWAGQEVRVGDEFELDSAPAGKPCPADLSARPFAPALTAGIADPTAGGSSPLSFRLTRRDGEQEIRQITAMLPAGLTAKLAGVAECSNAALAAISATAGSGVAERDRPACPEGSRIGSTYVGAGTGVAPLYVSGKAYLAGPYKGAPLSMAVVTPALAGPFDLGSVVVRVALNVDPTTARVTAISDPLPMIDEGVPLRLRDILVRLDRQGFVQAPTSCAPGAIASRVEGVSGAVANLSQHFQVTNCAALAFKPKLSLKLKGGTKRGSYPALRATLKAKPGQANIDRVSVALPHSAFLAQEHIRTVCTRVQFAADACPPGSIYGYARATTPLLEQPLQGPVYLRSSNNPLPDLVAALDGQIEIDLVGRIDSVNGGIRTSFEQVPDAPVSKFVLSMKGGKKGLLVNSRDLCKATNRAKVLIDGQNGKAADQSPVLKSSCGKQSSRRR